MRLTVISDNENSSVPGTPIMGEPQLMRNEHCLQIASVYKGLGLPFYGRL